MIIHPSNDANLFESIKFPPCREGYPRVDVQFEKSEFANQQNSANRNVSFEENLTANGCSWRPSSSTRIISFVRSPRDLCCRLVPSSPPFFAFFHSIFFFFFFSFFEVGSFGRIRSTSLFAQDEKERERRKILTKKGRREGFSLVGRTFTKEQKATGQGGKS